jgi:hypothetical protein
VIACVARLLRDDPLYSIGHGAIYLDYWEHHAIGACKSY